MSGGFHEIKVVQRFGPLTFEFTCSRNYLIYFDLLIREFIIVKKNHDSQTNS
jgi:hypothetical protein